MTPLESQTFVSRLTDVQPALRVHISILLGGDEEATKDVLQNTNVYLWKHGATFDPAKGSFLNWAKVQAGYQVLQYRRDCERESRRLLFDQETFDSIAATLAAEPTPEDDRDDLLLALQQCLESLPPADRQFVEAHYYADKSLKALASQLRLSISAAKMRMSRLRRQLDDCVTRHVCAWNGGKMP